MLATGAGAGIFGYQNLLRVGTVTGAGGAGFLEFIRIDNSGRVGIGTTGPVCPLNVVGNTFVTGGNYFADTSGGYFFGGFAGFGGGIYGADSGNTARIDAPQTIALRINNTERARIDSSGRLLIGTSSAETWFSSLAQIQAAGSEASFTAIRNQNSTSGAYLFLGKSRGTTANSTTVVQNGDEIGGVIFIAADGVNNRTQAASIYSYVDGTPGANDMPGRLVFSTTADGASSPTERVRITSGGDVLMGKTSVDWSIAGIQTEDTSRTLTITRSDAAGLTLRRNTSDGTIQQFARDGSVIGTISVTTTATAYNTSSDYRLKETVVPLTGAIDRVNELQVRRFNFIADPGKTVDGFIAHEAQEVVPECVTGTKDEVDDDGNPVYQGIDQSKIVPLVVAALQEALQKIEDLEGRLTAAGL